MSNLIHIPGKDVAEENLYWMNDFNSMSLAQEKTRMRLVRNRRAYSVVDDGQWPEGVAQKQISEGRQVCSYPIIPQKVDGLAGAIMANWFDESFVPVEGDISDKTFNLQSMLLSDKGVMDWNSSSLQNIKDGLICLGIEEMYIDTRYHDVGNIGFRNRDTTCSILDPGWRSKRGADLKRAYYVSDLTAGSILDIYKDVAQEIMDRAELEKKTGKTYFENKIEDKIITKRFKAGYCRVIQCDHLETEVETVEFDTLSRKEFPQTEFKFHSDEDIKEKKEWGDRNGIDWSAVALHDSIITYKRDVPIYYITTFCPELSCKEFLENKKSEIQIRRLPIFPYSFMWMDGIPVGVVDLLIDAQQTLNKRESTLTHILTTTANGALLADTTTMFNGDEKKAKDFIKEKNNPSKVFEVAPGALGSGIDKLVAPVTRGSQAVPELFSVINFTIDMMNRISRQPDAMEGRMEKSGQSGKSIGMLQAQAQMLQTTMMRDIRQHEKEKAEAYFFLAKQLYSAKNPLYGDANINRTFMSPDGDPKKAVVLNKYIGMDENKSDVIDDDIADLDRHRIIITESAESLSVRTIAREIDNALLQGMPPSPTNALSRAMLESDILRKVDFPEDMKEQTKEAAALQVELAGEQTRLALANVKSQRLQAEQNLKTTEQAIASGQPQVVGGQPPQDGQQPPTPHAAIPAPQKKPQQAPAKIPMQTPMQTGARL